MNSVASKAQNIQEMSAAISGIGRLVNNDLARRGSADYQPFLGETELGDLMLAVEHLSRAIEGLGEDIEGQELRPGGRS